MADKIETTENVENEDNILRYSLRVNRVLFKKFRYIAEAEGRSANKEIVQFIKRCVREFEEENGEIILNGHGR